MELSNKALAVLLLAAMVISLGGTLLSLNKMSSVKVVGYATTSTGIVNLSISDFISITTNESSLVDFGACTLNDSRAINLTSMSTQDTQDYCPTYRGANISNISVRNNGNVPANVTIASSVCAPGGGNLSCSFLNNSALGYTENGLFQFSTINAGRAGYTGACGAVETWTTLNGTHGYRACTNLLNGAVANSFVTEFLLRLPRGLGTGEKTATITYTASSP
jgi:hypothetical protein